MVTALKCEPNTLKQDEPKTMTNIGLAIETESYDTPVSQLKTRRDQNKTKAYMKKGADAQKFFIIVEISGLFTLIFEYEL